MDNLTFTSLFTKAAIFPTEAGVYLVEDVAGVLPSSYLIVEDSCSDDIRVKWLSSDGIYRHGSFSKYATRQTTGKDGNEVNIFNYSLSTAQRTKSLISKSRQDSMQLQKFKVSKLIYDIYRDLATSPKVYLNIGTLINAKWVEVKIAWTPETNYKKEFYDIKLTVTLPEHFKQML